MLHLEKCRLCRKSKLFLSRSGWWKEAFLRVIRAADEPGCRAVIVHAKDGDAKAFYEKYGFVPSPIEPLHLYLMIEDIEAAGDHSG